MKQILRIGERYGLSVIKRYTVCVLLMNTGIAWLPNNKTQAQEQQRNTYNQLIPASAHSQYGMLGVHEVGGKVYLEIPDSLLGRDILVINRLAKGWEGYHPYDPFLNFVGYSGDLINEALIRFEKVLPGKISIQTVSYNERTNDHAGQPQVTKNGAVLPVITSFDSLARNPAHTATLIEASGFLAEDNTVTTFSKDLRGKFQIGAYQSSASIFQGLRVAANDLGIRSTKAYSSAKGYPIRMEIGCTWFLLPRQTMHLRPADARVGYMTTETTDYTNANREPTVEKLVKRWRMEPRPADREAYFKGKLVEPAKPIVFYVDPAMPKAWVPYMIQGVNDWQAAFEQAGFKNAIRAERAPADDPNWSSGDSRYNVIAYKPSTVGNATGDVVVDPRSGEIVNAQISWHHGLLQMIRQWLFVQGATNLPGVRNSSMDTELTGLMIRSVIAHEVGHTLGLLHNFGASYATPMEHLRDKDWLAKNSLCPSIMDYVRLNYVAQPEDGIDPKNLFPRIGDYDKWAIEWAYRVQPVFETAEKERTFLQQWVVGKQKDPRLWYGNQDWADDPRCQAEDLSNDPVLAARYGMQNLTRLMDSLALWHPDTAQREQDIKAIAGQYTSYIKHAVTGLAGTGPSAEQALDFLDSYFFRKPKGLSETSLNSLQKELMPQILLKAALHPDTSLLPGLQQQVFASMTLPGRQNTYSRHLQVRYVDSLCQLLSTTEQPGQPERPYDVLLRLGLLRNSLAGTIGKALLQVSDSLENLHLHRLQQLLTNPQTTLI